MKYYSQIDTEYCNKELVPGITIKEYGCYFCCICTLAQIHPLELLRLCKKEKYCFTEKGLLYSGKVGSLAGIPYVGSFTTNTTGLGIIEMDSAVSDSTHFIIQYNERQYFDPLKGLVRGDYIDRKYSSYSFKSIRLFDNAEGDWIAKTRREGIEAGITNGERMEEPMIRAEGVKMCLNLLKNHLI